MIVDKIKKRESKNIRPSNKVDIQVGKWVKCDKCKEIIYKENLKENNKICPLCGHYFRVSSKRRIEQIIDTGTFEEFELNIDTVNPLQLEDYEKKLNILREKVGVDEAGTTAVISDDQDTLTVVVKDLAYPGAGAQFDVVIKNNGTIPAQVKSVTPSGLPGTTNILIEGLDVITAEHPVIEPNGTCSFSFTVEWDVTNATDLTDEEKTGIEFGLVVEYEQADATAFEGTTGHTDA